MSANERGRPKILIVEDDAAILMSLRDDLAYEGFAVTAAKDGRQGFETASAGTFDLIILDILLPRMNGFEVCKRLRDAGIRTPILMLTAARTQETDKVTGFEFGADDYVTKPFGARELMARIKALLRRGSAAKEDVPQEFGFGDVRIDFKRRDVSKDGRAVHLTPLEFDLLRLLVERQGEVVTRDEILDRVWDEAIVSPRTVEPHIVHLRQKLEDDPARPRYILGVRGVGYKLAI
jgi:DNA-binding response OmpR family regulator